MKKPDQEKNKREFEIQFYEKIIERCPRFSEALKALAELYTIEGHYAKGLALDERLAELLPSDATVFYNLACSYSLVGDVERSFQAIKKSLELGYDDFTHMRNDTDLTNLRQDKRFHDLLNQSFEKKNSPDARKPHV